MQGDKAIVILAAGAASRMGEPKQLLEYKSDTLLGLAITIANKLSLGKPTVVLGAYADRILASHQQHRANFVINPEWKLGMGNSLVFGLKTVLESNSRLQAILVLLADQPLISLAHLLELIKKNEASTQAVIATKYEEGGGVPAIFNKSFFPKLLSLKGDRGARSIIRDHADKVILLPEEDSLLDIDTPEDYMHLKKME